MQQTPIERRALNSLKVKNPYLRLGTDVSDLEKSIKTVGLIAPLVVTPDGTLLAGGRRYQALLNLGYTDALVTIIDQGELERELISIDENLVRKDLSKMEMEGHLRRAKELHQALHPEDFEMKDDDQDLTVDQDEDETVTRTKPKVKSERLPGESFLRKVSEKTGLSPKQIHEAIRRDEAAGEEIKGARARGELSLSQTNELVKLEKKDQARALAAVKNRPVREIKKLVKLAKTKGIDQAIEEMPEEPHAREFREIETNLTKLCRLLKRYQLEGLDFDLMPAKTRALFNEFSELASELDGGSYQDHKSSHIDSHAFN